MVEVIVRVNVRKDGVKYIIIPKHSDINSKEYVLVSNNMDMVNKIKEVKK